MQPGGVTDNLIGMDRGQVTKLANKMLIEHGLRTPKRGWGWTASCDVEDDGIFVAILEHFPDERVQRPWSLCGCGCHCACINPVYVVDQPAARVKEVILGMFNDIREEDAENLD